jgi:hypothetical protein
MPQRLVNDVTDLMHASTGLDLGYNRRKMSILASPFTVEGEC